MLKIPPAGSRLLQKHQPWPTDLDMPAALVSPNHTEQLRTQGSATSPCFPPPCFSRSLEHTLSFSVPAATKRLSSHFQMQNATPGLYKRPPHRGASLNTCALLTQGCNQASDVTSLSLHSQSLKQKDYTCLLGGRGWLEAVRSCLLL